jgi:two-component sensor histidine kinase
MSRARPCVLYIDDDEGLRRLVQKDLQRQNFDVEVAADGPSGVARIAKGGIDVVALDHYMPGQDGLATLAQIRALPSPPPVVYVTGAEEGRIAVAALKAGADDYVIKEVQSDFLDLLRRGLTGALEAREMRRAKEAAEQEVRAARDRFEALAAERALLLREVNHRVGNSLQLIASLLHMQSMVAAAAETKNALAEATSRVAAVAQVHRRLYTSEDVHSVALDQYIEGLIGDLRNSAKGPAARDSISLTADPVEIHPDSAVAVGMLVTELVINALKYAYPGGSGPIRVQIACDGTNVRVAVEDDGVGLKGASQSGSGLGQRIVQAMANKLGARVEVDPTHQGTRVQVVFAEAT